MYELYISLVLDGGGVLLFSGSVRGGGTDCCVSKCLNLFNLHSILALLLDFTLLLR